jgi:hypothetical protein
MTAFSPGQSPPPVSTPIFIDSPRKNSFYRAVGNTWLRAHAEKA